MIKPPFSVIAVILCILSLKPPFLPFPTSYALCPQVLGNHDHTLLVLIIECLSNRPARRPNADDIVKRIEELRKVDKKDLMTMDKMRLIEELQKLRSDFEELQVS